MKLLSQVVEDHMREALTEAKGNIRQAARLIGVHQNCFYRRRDVLFPGGCKKCGKRQYSAFCMQGICK